MTREESPSPWSTETGRPRAVEARLAPVVTEMGRALVDDTTIDGVRLPAGTTAVASILLVQRDPDRHEDPLTFRPERFLDCPPDIHSWLPFGGGVRRCIGAAFAQLESTTVLRTILSRVELRAVGPMERPSRRSVTVVPGRGTRVELVGPRRIAATRSA